MALKCYIIIIFAIVVIYVTVDAKILKYTFVMYLRLTMACIQRARFPYVDLQHYLLVNTTYVEKDILNGKDMDIAHLHMRVQ